MNNPYKAGDKVDTGIFWGIVKEIRGRSINKRTAVLTPPTGGE